MRFRCERLNRRSAFTATNATGPGAVFTCPSAKVAHAGRQLNYSANPNVCKDERFSALVRATAVPRPTETLLAADGIQYRPNGDAQAIFWGMQNAAGANLRCRHSGRVVAWFVAGNAQACARGRVTEGQFARTIDRHRRVAASAARFALPAHPNPGDSPPWGQLTC